MVTDFDDDGGVSIGRLLAFRANARGGRMREMTVMVGRPLGRTRRAAGRIR